MVRCGVGVSSGHYATCLLFADEQAGKRKTCMLRGQSGTNAPAGERMQGERVVQHR